MKLSDIKPMHCKMILNRTEADYAGSTIRQTYIAMGSMFKAAKMNGIISVYPMDGVRYTKPVRAVDGIHFLTVEEQDRFLEVKLCQNCVNSVSTSNGRTPEPL